VTSQPSDGRPIRLLGVLVGLLLLVLAIAVTLFGLPITPLVIFGPIVVVVLLSVVALRRAVSKTQERLAWLTLATAGLWLLASSAYVKLVEIELDLVSQAKSPDLVAAVGWVALVVGLATYVGLLFMGARLLTGSAVRRTDVQI
jgi:hypothetical protein